MFQAGALIAGKFRLIEPLGEGGMGAVWRAHHEGLDVPCAVKLIRADTAELPGIRARFEREAKAAAAMRSPHVVSVYDHGVWEETPYMAMELLEGEDLRHRLMREGRLAAEETVSIVAQVARALTKAHAAGLVHRDLKPDNIFLARDDDREIAKVLDFGIAKASAAAADGTKTKTGAIIGTPNYMSPEQAQGTKVVDHRSDLWSLAVVVYECVVGRPPFESEALGDLLLQIMMQPLPVPSGFTAVPPAFDAWWAKAAARDPDARFQSAKQLAEALGVALDVTGAASTTEVGRRSLPGARSGVTGPASFGAAPARSSGGNNTAAGAPAVSLSGAPVTRRGVGVFVVGALAGVATVVLALYALVLRGPAAPTASAAAEASAAQQRAPVAAAPDPPRAAAPAVPTEAPAVAPAAVASASSAPSAAPDAAPEPAPVEAPQRPAGARAPVPAKHAAAPAAKPPAAPAKPTAAPAVKKPTDYGF